MEHQARSIISPLRQVLSHDKRPLGLFFGAGCPASILIENDGQQVPLIAGIAGLSTQLSETIANTHLADPFRQVVTNLRADGTPSPNIEDVLTHIRSLRAVAGPETVRGLSIDQLRGLESWLSDKIVSIVDRPLPSAKTPFHSVAVWIDSRPRKFPVQVFTTNYDLLIEQALEGRRVACFDGFIGSHRPFFDPYAMDNDVLPPRWARLWKLHGSINWVIDEDEHVYRISLSDKTAKRRVIHPSHLKYDESRRMPFLAMADRLRSFFAEPSAVLVTCGYSFGDIHINEIMEQGLRGNPDSVLFALVCGPLSGYGAARDIALRQPNFTLLGDDAAIWSGRYGTWKAHEPNTTAVVGINHSGNNGSNSDSCTVTLGDFGVFGLLLDDLIGSSKVQQIVAPSS